MGCNRHFLHVGAAHDATLGDDQAIGRDVRQQGETYLADNESDSDEAATFKRLQAAACTYRIAFDRELPVRSQYSFRRASNSRSRRTLKAMLRSCKKH